MSYTRNLYLFLLILLSVTSAAFARDEPIDFDRSGGASQGSTTLGGRCTTNDSNEWVAQIGWAGDVVIGDVCPGWGDTAYDIGWTVFDQCLKRFGDNKLKIFARPVEDISRSLKGGKHNSIHDYMMAVGEWSGSMFIDGVSASVISDMKSHLQKCAIRSYARIIPGPPGMKDTAAKLGEVIAEILDVHKILNLGGADKVAKQVQQLSNMGKAAKYGGKAMLATKEYKRFVDRTNKFYQAADSVDWFKDAKNAYDNLWFEGALEDCDTENAMDRLEPIRDSYISLIKEARNDMLFIEREVYCIEEYERTASFLGWALDAGARSLSPFGDVNRKKGYYQWVNNRQCEISGFLADLHKLAVEDIANKRKEREDLFFEFEELKKQYVALRRDCSRGGESNWFKIDKERKLLDKMRALAEKPCGRDLDVPALERFTTPQETDKEKFDELLADFNRGIKRCYVPRAENALNELLAMGDTTDFHCKVEHASDDHNWEEQLARLKEDRQNITALWEKLPNKDGINAYLLEGCGFDAAEQALIGLDNEWENLPITYPQCKEKTSATKIPRRLKRMHKYLDGEGQHVIRQEEIYLGKLEENVRRAVGYLEKAKAGGPERCRHLADAIYRAEVVGKLNVQHRWIHVCENPESDQQLKAYALEILAEAQGLQGDTSAVQAIIAEAENLLNTECDFAAIDGKIAEIDGIKESVCVDTFQGDIDKLKADRDKLVNDYEVAQSSAAGAVLQLDEGITACNADVIRSAIEGISEHQCMTKLADPELKQALDKINQWRSAPDVIVENVNIVKNKVAEAEGYLTGCEPELGLQALLAAESAMETLRSSVHPSCDAIAPEIQRIPELRSKLEQRQAEIQQLTQKIMAQIVKINADIELTKKDISFAGEDITEAIRQKLIGDVANLKEIGAEIQAKALTPGCDERLINAARDMMARISALRVPDSKEEEQTEDDSGEDTEEDTEENSDDSSSSSSSSSSSEDTSEDTTESPPTGDNAPLPDPVYDDPEPDDDDDLDGLLDDMEEDALDGLGADRNRARNTGQRVTNRARNTGNRAEGEASDWTSNLPQPVDQGDIRDAVNRGRRQRGEQDAYGADGQLIPTQPRYDEPQWPGEPYGGGHTGGHAGGGGSGGYDDGMPTTGSVLGQDDPGTRPTPPRGNSGNDIAKQCKKMTKDCIAKAEKNKRDAKKMFAEFKQAWTAKDEREHQKALKWCRDTCRNINQQIDNFKKGGYKMPKGIPSYGR